MDTNFERIKLFYDAINELNKIIATPDDDRPTNFECKLDAALNAISDINKAEINNKIANEIVVKIKEGVEDIYQKDMLRAHKAIGINMSFDHCAIEKNDSDDSDDTEYYDDDDEEVKPVYRESNFDVKVNTSVEDPVSSARSTPNIPSFLKSRVTE